MISYDINLNLDTLTGLTISTTHNMKYYWSCANGLPGDASKENTYALLISVICPYASFQLLLHYDEGKLFYRVKSSTGWLAWKIV